MNLNERVKNNNNVAFMPCWRRERRPATRKESYQQQTIEKWKEEGNKMKINLKIKLFHHFQ
jgi:hypothetical protein